MQVLWYRSLEDIGLNNDKIKDIFDYDVNSKLGISSIFILFIDVKVKDIYSVKWTYCIEPKWNLKWPLSILISPESIERLKRIHQFLLQLCHINYCLKDMWTILKRTRVLNPEDCNYMNYIGMYNFNICLDIDLKLIIL